MKGTGEVGAGPVQRLDETAVDGRADDVENARNVGDVPLRIDILPEPAEGSEAPWSQV
ncbi:MAG: hypothetical protein R3D28_20240 [Geminicoccaceae bacterium]